MEDREFFDTLYQMWAKTTHAKERFWDYQPDDLGGLCEIRAVSEDGGLMSVASDLFESDADWITAVHGCFPDLVRRLHAALDEADEADFDRDSRECYIAELVMEVTDLKKVIDGLSKNPPWQGEG